MTTRELTLPDGRTLEYLEAGEAGGPVLLAHHGTPGSGRFHRTEVEAARRLGARLVAYSRPGYAGSSPQPGRSVADAAADVVALLDALGAERFATYGWSGGGPHALACAALLGARVTGVACLASLAPIAAEVDWFAGMVAPGGLRAAVDGREARARHAASDEFDEDSFTAADRAALSRAWASLGEDAVRAGTAGPGGLIDDDVAFVAPWGSDVARIEAPVLLVQGGEDRIVPPAHTDWLLRHCPRSELWLRPRDGHVSVLDACPLAMDWLVAAAAGARG